MEASQVRRALGAATAAARELGLHVDDATVLQNSDRIAVRLHPCDVVARVGLQAEADGFQFEADIARALRERGSPVGALEPRAGSRVYFRDTFAITLWTYYEPVGVVAPAAYADALFGLHAGLRPLEIEAPHVSVRIAGWVEDVNDPEQTPGLPKPDRQLLSDTFRHVQSAISRSPGREQLLHGEPHPGNLLSTAGGPRFIDFHTCQRGPVEYDLAYLPEDAAALYPGADQGLVHLFRILMWAGITTMRWGSGDQFPNRDYWQLEGLRQLRAALARA